MPGTAVQEVLDVADGRNRADIEQRADGAFAYANRLRGRGVDRLAAVDTTVTWAHILCYLEATGGRTFHRGEYGEAKLLVAASWMYGTGYSRAILGRKPFDFRQVQC